MDPDFTIAVVGMSGAFAGADDLDEYWRNLLAGRESLVDLTDDDLRDSGVDPAVYSRANYVPRAAAMRGEDMFDANFFQMSPREAELMDPQQRLFLEHCWRAVEDAGYDVTRLGGSIGVFGGSSVNTYVEQLRRSVRLYELAREGVALHEVGAVENDADFLTTRVSFKLDLRGPSLNVTTACSTSLVAVHVAMQSLQAYECDAALAGGIAVCPPLKQGYLFQEGGIASPDGRTRTFDKAASGTVLGAGVGVLVLKRLTDAIADGDNVRAVLIGSAVNNDGSGKAGFTAPSSRGQVDVLERAYAAAQVSPADVGYVEAHGTATRLGDPIEVAALTKVFSEAGAVRSSCLLGSVKPNIGHTDAAAGVAGLIKAVLAVESGQVPPNINFEVASPVLDLESGPFRVPIEVTEWPGAAGRPRLAGVSAFGFGGTNAHVVVGEAPPRTMAPAPDAGPIHFLQISGRTEAAVADMAGNLADRLAAPDAPALADAAWTLRNGRAAMRHRAVVAVTDREQAVGELRARAAARPAAHGPARDLIFLFPGQGSQYTNMGADLRRAWPDYAKVFDGVVDAFESLGVPGLRAAVMPNPEESDEVEAALGNTALIQPALFAVEYALATHLMASGLTPASMLGHSLGEFVAATVAGVFDLDTAIRVIALRSRSMAAARPGAMLAVALDEDELLPRLGGLQVAALNGPKAVVVTGETDIVVHLERLLAADGVRTRRLKVSHAAHSRMMLGAADELRDMLCGVRLSKPRMTVMSNVTGEPLTAQQATSPDYWREHMLSPVQFARGLANAVAGVTDPCVLEVGPGGALGRLAKSVLPGDVAGRVHATIGDAADPADAAKVLRILGTLVEHGVPVGDADGGRVRLPTYAFQRKRYWVEEDAPSDLEVSRRLADVSRDPADWLYVPQWRSLAPVTSPTTDAAVVVVSDGSPLADALLDGIRARTAVVAVVAAGTAGQTVAAARLSALEELTRGLTLATRADGWRTASARKLVVVCSAVPQADDVGGKDWLPLLAAARIAAAAPDLDVELHTVTEGVHDLGHGERLNDSPALAVGLTKVLAREHANLVCRVTDVAQGSDADALVAELLADVRPEDVVAIRGRWRWTPSTAAVRAMEPDTGPWTRTDASHVLVTGGSGGVGLALAEHILGQSECSVTLTHRRDVEDLSEDDARVLGRVSRLADFYPGRVTAVRADVGDRASLDRAVAEAEAAHGPVDAVLHLAGMPGGGLAQVLSPDDFARTLRGKVLGARNLLDLLKRFERPARLTLFSSLNVVDPRFGVSDYTAANTVLGTLAADARRRGLPVQAVDWCGWSELGMAVDAGASRSGTRERDRSRIMSEAGEAAFISVADGWRVLRLCSSLDAPQVHVSPQDLAAIVERGRRLDVARAVEVLTDDEASGVDDAAAEDDATPMEAFVVNAFRRVLGEPDVHVDTDFFSVGGNSLLALDVLDRCRRRWDCRVTLVQFLGEPTPAGLAGLLEAERPVAAAGA